MKAEEITKLIEEDQDIGISCSAHRRTRRGPGRSSPTLAGGRLVGTFPIPITVVPGCLGLEEILGARLTTEALPPGGPRPISSA